MKRSSPHSRVHRAGRIALLLSVLAGVPGCLLLPVNYFQQGSRHNVDPESGTRLAVGVASRADVILELGEPDLVSEDGQRIGYAWTKVRFLLIVASYGGGGSAEIERSHVLAVSFDASNRVSEVQLLKEWGPTVTPRHELETKP